MRKLLLVLALPLAFPAALHAQTAADSAAVRRAALDYIEGWYGGDAARMQRAVHPDLAKRIVRTDAKGESWLSATTADGLVHSTRLGSGRDVPPERQQKDVRILTMDGDMASVRLVSTKLVDYMHLARWNGEWRIVNVLWDFRPEHRPKP
ncbi:MAG TPA: nuclear transport factor 2 family protein [Longimicrobiaceae bacterium]|nr:nuclear transport factor 2 family protein [Longimicrobiaceae bacterium]